MSTTQVPDGKGGWIEVTGEKQAGKKADLEKQAAALAAKFNEDAAGMTDWFWKQGRLYQNENALEPEHVAFAVALLCINVRETFPKGKEAFDALSAMAADYYDDATKKKG